MRTASCQTYWLSAITASGGGGGRGMRVVRSDAELAQSISMTKAKRKAASANDIGIRKTPKIHHYRNSGAGGTAVARRYLSGGTRSFHAASPPVPVACRIRRRNCRYISERCAARRHRLSRRSTFEFCSKTASSISSPNTRIQLVNLVTEMITGVDLIKEQCCASRRVAAVDHTGRSCRSSQRGRMPYQC